jgi:hypothetical protein
MFYTSLKDDMSVTLTVLLHFGSAIYQVLNWQMGLKLPYQMVQL